MPEGSVGPEDGNQQNVIEPDLFGFYKREIIALLNEDENFLHLSSRDKGSVNLSSKLLENCQGTDSSSRVCSLFDNSVEAAIPDYKRNLLKASLRQSVRALTQEVDEVFDPVIGVRHVISCLNSKKKQESGEKALMDRDTTMLPCKKLKASSSIPKGQLLADQSGDAEKETEISEDVKLLLESEDSEVEEIMAKHSDQLYIMLNHMEQQLEELLDAVVLKCRPMTFLEKQQLRKLIQKLPPENLNRIVEIIHHGKPPDTVLSDKIIVDLEEQGNSTLWRLYFYVKAVENARKLSA